MVTESFSLATMLNSYEAEMPTDPDISGAALQHIHALCGSQTKRQWHGDRAGRGQPRKWYDTGFNNNPITRRHKESLLLTLAENSL